MMLGVPGGETLKNCSSHSWSSTYIFLVPTFPLVSEGLFCKHLPLTALRISPVLGVDLDFHRAGYKFTPLEIAFSHWRIGVGTYTPQTPCPWGGAIQHWAPAGCNLLTIALCISSFSVPYTFPDHLWMLPRITFPIKHMHTYPSLRLCFWEDPI